MKTYWVYILASQRNGSLYVGVTSNIGNRVYQHKEKFADGFTKKYDIDKLVYAEAYEDRDAALARERNMKAWKREWKVNLIKKLNPEWNDLYSIIN